MKRKYLDLKIPENWVPIIAHANRELEHFSRNGIETTLRGLFYRFIGADLFPDTWIDDEYNAKNNLTLGTKNTLKNYKRLGGIISDARMAGLIDWDHLKDIVRQTDVPFTWDDYETDEPSDIIRGRARAFTLDRWGNSPYHVEVMVEKDAAEGIVAPVAEEYGCPFTSNRGYSSITAQRNSGLRLRDALDDGKHVVVLYIGDHDPSGIDMTRELEYKLDLFSGGKIEMKRLALNRDQIDQYQPPPNPAKTSDSRARAYIEEHGNESWELEALDALLLREIVRQNIEEYVDHALLNEILDRQEAYKLKLSNIADAVDRMMEEEGEE